MSKRAREKEKQMLLKQIEEKRAKLEHRKNEAGVWARPAQLPFGMDPLNPELYKIPPELLKSVVKKTKKTPIQKGKINSNA